MIVTLESEIYSYLIRIELSFSVVRLIKNKLFGVKRCANLKYVFKKIKMNLVSFI